MTLYKFLRPELLSVLRYSQIRYTQLGDLDDHFERVKNYILTGEPESINTVGSKVFILTNDIILDPQKQLKFRTMVNDLVKKSIQRDPFYRVGSMHVLDSYDYVSDAMIGFRTQWAAQNEDNSLFLCLSEASLNELMWSLYATKKGFAIGFDTSHEYFQLDGNRGNDGILNKVIYQRKLPRNYPDLMTFTEQYLTKYNSWKYQKEWRIKQSIENAICSIDAKPYPIYLFDFPPISIKEILVGPDANNELVSEIIHLISDKSLYNVKLYKVCPKPGTFKYMKEEIRF